MACVRNRVSWKIIRNLVLNIIPNTVFYIEFYLECNGDAILNRWLADDSYRNLGVLQALTLCVEVFAVRSGGATGVVVKGPDANTTTNFRLEDKGNVISIKFSPNQQILALQRSQTSVEFVNFFGKVDTLEYSQNCKSQTSKILGFVWTDISQIAFVTDHGVELYQVIADRRQLKLLKNHSVNINWFVFSSTSNILLLSCGALGNQLQPFQFKVPSTMYKFPKFEVDLPNVQYQSRHGLSERDVTLANICGQTRVVILRYQPRSLGTAGAEVVIYTFPKDGPARKTDILKLDISGRFAVNIVDNLVIVHHQTSKTSMVFDMQFPGESDGYVVYHHPVATPLPIKAFKLQVPLVPSQLMSESAEVSCELYSPNWVVFQPNIIIDAKLGCLWYITLCLDAFLKIIPEKGRLLDFLLRRNGSKLFILQVCREMLQKPNPNLADTSRVFDKLNAVYKQQLTIEILAQTATPVLALNQPRVKLPTPTVVVDQSDMYTHVFTPVVENKDANCKSVVAILMEYIRSLSQVEIPVQHYMYELVINALLQQKAFYQLHQLLQYHVLSDSKPLACLLLSLKGAYAPAYQLALDMLKRLDLANEEIVEVLLFNQQLIPVLRFIRSAGMVDTASARKFLDASMGTNDPATFYSVFNFFEQRNFRLRGSPSFAKGEHCEIYVQHFEKLFGKNSSIPYMQSQV